MKKNIVNYNRIINRVRAFSSKLKDPNICEDKDSINKLRNLVSEDKALLRSLIKYSDETTLKSDLEHIEEIAKSRDANRELLMKSLKTSSYISSQRSIRVRALAVISGIAAAIFFVSYLIYNDMNSDIELLKAEAQEVVKLPTSSSYMSITEPTLILDDGYNIALANPDTAFLAANMIDNNSVSSMISYRKMSEINTNSDSVELITPKTNTLRVPSKYSYTVTLADETVVYVSANSELTYPTSFNGDTREVELKGMAYFDVKKSDKPFIVKSGGVDINVYGTKFNVEAYEKGEVITTLISGSVGVKYNTIDGFEEVKLSPKEQLSVNTSLGQSILDDNIDTTAYTLWLDGYFYSDKQPVVELLKSLSYWYGVEFRYELGTIETIKVHGSLSREVSVDEILELIELISDVKFNKRENIYYVESAL